MRRKLAPLILIGAGLLAYSNTFRVPFIFDDQNAIVRNLHIRSLWPPWDAMITQAQTPVAGRPIVNLSLAINYAISGLHPWSYHAFNLIIHILNALLLFGIVCRTLDHGKTDSGETNSNEAAAFAIALIWLVHPLLTESVTYVVQRTELLMALFFLLTLYCVIRGRYFGAIVACALGMGAKEVMAVVPVVVLLYDRTFMAGSFREALRQRWQLYAGLAATWLVLMASITGGARSGSVGLHLHGLTPIHYALTECGVIARYLRLAVLPYPLALDYDDWPIAQSVTDVWPAVLFILALLAATLWALWRKPQWGFLGAFFFLVLAPTSSFVPVVTEVAAERRMYLPLAALVTGVVLTMRCIVKKPRRQVLIVVLVGAGFFVMTVGRNYDYASEILIWSDTVKQRPNNARAQMSLGVALFQQGDVDDALTHLREATRLKPGYSAAHDNLGAALASQHHNEEAIAEFRESLRYDSANAHAHYNLGLALMQSGDLTNAVPHFTEAIRLEPDYTQAREHLTSALEQLGGTNAAPGTVPR